MRRRTVNQDPRVLTAKFDSLCAETRKKINKGDECVYYPSRKEVYHIDSNQAYEFRNWKQDQDNGYNY